jgi:uncharacterized protein
MATRTDHRPGTPCWLDLASPNLDETAEFYRGMFGWEAIDQGPETGGYRLFMLRDQMVGAAAQLMSGHQPAWRIYVCTADADATAAAVRSAGGAVAMEPSDVMDIGRMAVFTDSTGAALAAWEPKLHRGVQLADEPNTWCWSELLTRDVSAAISFYRAVFGWDIDQNPDYSLWQHDGEEIAGLMAVPPMVPAEVPSFWMPHIAAADVDAALARAVELGGSVRVPAQDIPGGRFGIINDVHGAGLGLLNLERSS